MEGANWPSLLWTLIFDDYIRKNVVSRYLPTTEFFVTSFVIFSDQDSQFGKCWKYTNLINIILATSYS